MSWEIFVGIAAIVSFVAAVTAPMLKLNTSITKLNASVDILKQALDRIEENNTNDHRRIWEHNEMQDERIASNTQRIANIEYTMDVTERLHPELTGLRNDLSHENK